MWAGLYYTWMKRFSSLRLSSIVTAISFVAALAQEEENIASDIYRALPTTTFTRTISNPEVVMKKRREKKLQTKLKEMKQGILLLLKRFAKVSKSVDSVLTSQPVP